MKTNFCVLGFALLLSACRAPEPSGQIAEVSRMDFQGNEGDFEIRLLPSSIAFERRHKRKFFAYMTVFHRQGSGWIECRVVSNDQRGKVGSEVRHLRTIEFANGVTYLHVEYVGASVEVSFAGGTARLVCPTIESAGPTIFVQFGYSPAIWLASDEDMDMLRIQLPPARK